MKLHWGFTILLLVIGFVLGGYFGGIAGVRAKLGV